MLAAEHDVRTAVDDDLLGAALDYSIARGGEHVLSALTRCGYDRGPVEMGLTGAAGILA
jgi:hypothetical protein